MKAFVDDLELPIQGMVVYEDLNQIYTTIELVSPFYVSGLDITLRSDKILKCKVLRSVFENKMYRYTLVSEKTWSLLNTNCSSFTGEADVNTLLANIGIRNSVKIPSNKTFWVVPATKLKVVLRYLNNYTSIQSGGAPRFYVDLDGNLMCVDLKKAYNSNKTIQLSGDVGNEFRALDWVMNNPGNIDVFSYSKDGIKRSKIEVGVGHGSLKINDTTGHATRMITQRVTNEYNFSYYSSRKVMISNAYAETSELGTLVKLGQVEDKFIVYSRSVTIPVGEEPPTVKLVLCAPCLK